MKIVYMYYIFIFKQTIPTNQTKITGKTLYFDWLYVLIFLIKSLQGIWSGVLHHVLNEHEWLFNYGSGSNRCSHGPLAEDREAEWLKKGSKAHQALVRIVMDRRLLNNVQYFLNFR